MSIEVIPSPHFGYFVLRRESHYCSRWKNNLQSSFIFSHKNCRAESCYFVHNHSFVIRKSFCFLLIFFHINFISTVTIVSEREPPCGTNNMRVISNPRFFPNPIEFQPKQIALPPGLIILATSSLIFEPHAIDVCQPVTFIPAFL